MANTESRPRTPFDPIHPNALAIYCSDGRFTRAVESLADLELDHARIDTLTIPGGPGCLTASSGGYSESEVIRRASSFLITAHHIETVLLVAHSGCGWYREKMGFYRPEVIEKRQADDLRETSRWLLQKHPSLAIHAFYARPSRGLIEFDRVALTP